VEKEMKYADLVQSYTGKQIFANEQPLTIVGLESKVGTLNDELLPYMAAKDANGDAVSVHPAIANKLLTTGKGGGFTAHIMPKVVVQSTTQHTISTAPVQTGGRGEKKSAAIAIYIADRSGGKSRKETIGRFVNEVGMSVAAASTYYQNCKSQWVK
jgi:hypothetical protein